MRNDRLRASVNDLGTHFFRQHYSWLLIVLTPCVLFVPMLIRGEALFWGTPLLQFVPWREFAFDVISDGFVPLWNPLLGMGVPLIANYQSALFYPPNGILFLVGPAWGHGLLVLIHIIWAGMGMRSLSRELGLGVFAQTVAALSFSLSGFMIARAGFLSINAAAAWLPWIIFMAERLTKEQATSRFNRSNIRSIIFLGILFGFQWLAGHAQTAWYSLVFTAIWIIWRGFSRGRLRGVIRVGSALSAAGLLGFLLSSIQLLPVLEYLMQSQRAADLDPEFALNYSFWPWRIFGLLMPNLFGNPSTGNYWGYANFWEDAIYMGVFPLVLGSLFLLRTIRKVDEGRLPRFLFFVIVVSMILALGKYTPIFTFLFENVPTFNLFQAPTRWSFLFVFSFALLAGLGANYWEKSELIGLFWVRLGTVGAAAICVIALLAFFVLPDIQDSFIPSLVMMGVWLTLIGIVAWRRRLRPSIVWPVVACLLLSIDMVWAGWGLNPSVDMDIYENQSELVNSVSDDHRVFMSSDMEYRLKFEQTHRFDTFFPNVDWRVVRDSGIPNTTMLDGVSSLNNFDPILSARYVEWLTRLETLTAEEYLRWLSFVDVGWISQWDSSDINTVHYQVTPNPQRAHLLGQVVWVENGEQALEIIFEIGFDPHEQVVIERSDDTVDRAWGSDGQITLIKQTNPNTVQLMVSTPTDTILVLSDLWFPGWIAEIDGVRSEIFQANYVLRALLIEPGSHTIEFEYRPLSFTIGVVISLISLTSMGFVLWKIKRN